MFILNFDYILDEGSSDSLEKLNQTSPSKADQCEYKEQFMFALSPFVNYNTKHCLDGCFNACPFQKHKLCWSPAFTCSGAVHGVPATQLLWHVDTSV